jgi:hypothetical protein
MDDPLPGHGSDQRRSPRVDYDEQVTIELPAAALRGQGENISDQGVYLRAAARIRVLVRLGADGEVRSGQLVRVETIGDGSLGIAIRFDAPVGRAPA